jgi:hypothetical protein
MVPKNKSRDTGNLDMPENCHQVFPVSEKVKVRANLSDKCAKDRKGFEFMYVCTG